MAAGYYETVTGDDSAEWPTFTESYAFCLFFVFFVIVFVCGECVFVCCIMWLVKRWGLRKKSGGWGIGWVSDGRTATSFVYSLLHEI